MTCKVSLIKLYLIILVVHTVLFAVGLFADSAMVLTVGAAGWCYAVYKLVRV